MILLLDLGVILILALAAWRGWVKGFVLSLCGLLAVIVAFVGATYISNHLSEPVSDFLQPYILDHLENAMEELPSHSANPSATPSPSFSLPMLEDKEKVTEELEATLSEILSVVKESELFSRLTESIETAIQDGTLTVVTTAASAIAAHIAQQVARIGLFFLSFVLIVVIWCLFSHMVDLAFHLPVLRTLNEAGGLTFGLIEGALLLVVLCSGLVAFDVVPAATAAQTRLFSLFLRFQII